MSTEHLPELPPEFVVRPARIDEVENLIAPTWAIDARYSPGHSITLQDFTDDLQRPHFDLARDSRAIFAPNGDCAGYVDVSAETPFVQNFLYVATHPAYEGLGLGTWMTRWGVQRLGERLPDAPPTTPFGVIAFPYTANTAALALLEHEGFVTERIFYQMAIDFSDGAGRTAAPTLAPLPAGITLRTFDPEHDRDALFEVFLASFRDHYGYVERPREIAYERWRHAILEHSTFDPALVTLAESQGEVVGFTVAWREEDAADSGGYVQHLGTVRAWRRRGLARALLTRVFATFYELGAPGVTLGVDAASPTGALNLYESAGMHVQASTTSLLKLLRPGEVPAEQGATDD